MQTITKPTQAQQIEKHLLSGKSITALDALNLYGCMRLAARIAELKESHEIESEPWTTPGGATIARYWIPASKTHRQEELPL